MQEYAERITGASFSMEQDLKQEFEIRLSESSTLAFRVAFSVLRNAEHAEDVAQEAFAKAYSHFHQLRDRERFRAWLVRMTWRLALDRQRGDRRRAAREANTEGPQYGSPTALEDLAARERAEHLWAAIDALPDKLRVVIVLSNIEGHDIREVARLLNLPDGTVKSRLFLARQRLKEQLQWMLSDPAGR